MNSSTFKIVEGNKAANAEGISVTLTGPFALLYKETRKDGERSIQFVLDSTFAQDTVLTYLIKVPEKLSWIETGTLLNAAEFSALKTNVTEALKEFQGIALFINKRRSLARDSSNDVDAFLASLLSEGN
jgi:hypothetical protein